MEEAEAETTFHMAGLLTTKDYQKKHCQLFLKALSPSHAAAFLESELISIKGNPADGYWRDFTAWINVYVIAALETWV